MISKADEKVQIANHGKGFLKVNVKKIHGKLEAELPAALAQCTVKGNCFIGAYSYIGHSSEIWNTRIGRFSSIAPSVVIGPTEHPTDRLSTHLFAFGNDGPFKGLEEHARWKRGLPSQRGQLGVNIGNDVWVGRNVTIRRGVNVGDGAVIGAGSVVSRDIPPYCVVAGAPAKIIRCRFDNHTVVRLLNTRWWQYCLDRVEMPDLNIEDVCGCLDQLEVMIADRSIKPLESKIVIVTSEGIFERD